MQVIIADIYGDRKVLRVFEDKPGIDEAIDEFHKVDKDYAQAMNGDVAYHGGFEEFMKKKGFTLLSHRFTVV
jgi:hypothetical protein